MGGPYQSGMETVLDTAREESGLQAELEEVRYVVMNGADDPKHNLNNFHLRLPGGWYRSLFAKRGLMDALPGDIGSYPSALHSQLFLENTVRHFFDSIDVALRAASVDINECEELLEREMTQELHQLILPAYENLRRTGYTHLDLTK